MKATSEPTEVLYRTHRCFYCHKLFECSVIAHFMNRVNATTKHPMAYIDWYACSHDVERRCNRKNLPPYQCDKCLSATGQRVPS